MRAIAAAGGTIVAGSAAPAVPYGLGLHVELDEFVRAGMTLFQALQTATVNAAQALGLRDEAGTIEPGRQADLTFLGSDPVTDIRNTRDVKRVMLRAKLYTVGDLTAPDHDRRLPRDRAPKRGRMNNASDHAAFPSR